MNALWNILRDQQLVTGEKPAVDAIHIPWYIRFMQGFAGWIAAFFILGFFAVTFAFVFKKPTGGLLIVLGMLCSFGAHRVMKLKTNDFLDQIAMAFSLCGQIMVAIGLFLLRVNAEAAFFILGLYQLSLAWLMPHYAHRLLSTSFGLLALIISLNLMSFHGIGSALIAVLFAFIWLKEVNWENKRELWEPIGFGVAITIVFGSGFLITGKDLLNESIRDSKSWLYYNAELISSLLIALVLVNIIMVLLKEYKINFKSKTAVLCLLAAIGLVLISFKIYGLSTGLMLILIGFARQRMTLIVLGSLTVVSFFSWYYYNLHASLLFKSVTLMVLGFVLLMSWLGINYIYGNKTENKLKQMRFKVINKNKWLAAATVFIAIIAINININKKQDTIANGEILLLKLAPVDPRSLMQGDYMRLRFELANEILSEILLKNAGTKTKNYQGFAVAQKGDNNIVSFVELYHNQGLKDKQLLIPFKLRNYQVIFTTNAFYFQEGKASHFQKAEYGLFRLSQSGEMLLTHMLDKDFNEL